MSKIKLAIVKYNSEVLDFEVIGMSENEILKDFNEKMFILLPGIGGSLLVRTSDIKEVKISFL